MTESSGRDYINGRMQYVNGMTALVLLGTCIRIPFVLNVMAQLCLLICTMHLIFRCIKAHRYLMALVAAMQIVMVGVMDVISFRILYFLT